MHRLSLTDEERKEMEAEVIRTMKDRALYPVRRETWLKKHPEKANEENPVHHEEFLGYARGGEKLCHERFEEYVKKYGKEEGEKLKQELLKMEERARRNY